MSPQPMACFYQVEGPKQLCSESKDLSAFPFLEALGQREELVRNGKLTSIIFLRTKNHKGQEVSGYIDYAHRLKVEDFEVDSLHARPHQQKILQQ